MAEDKPTPEEQLLNLIERKNDFIPQKPEGKKLSFFAFVNLKKFIFLLPFLKRFIRKKQVRLKSSIKEPNLKIINKLLVGSSIILVFYLIIDFTFRRLDIKQIYSRPSVDRELSFKEPSEKESRPFLYYLEMVQRRNIFSPIVLKGTEVSEAEAKKLLDSLVKDIKLVGISWGEQPQVMLEDTKNNKTYFLKSGDMIEKLKVESILKDRVILIYEGQRVELM